jgi:hypothetical protein
MTLSAELNRHDLTTVSGKRRHAMQVLLAAPTMSLKKGDYAGATISVRIESNLVVIKLRFAPGPG